MIHVNKLIFEYPKLRALNNVSFQLPKSSITALVGPNGAGKTTLLRCMAALESPVSGDIHIDGIDVSEHPRDCHRIIGYLSDFFGLYERLSVQQCLHYVARAQGLTENETRLAIEKVSTGLNITALLETLTGQLSRGQRQRVAIGQAIIHSPRVVLFDEPASGLDPEARAELAKLFVELQQQGMTLLVSSHILAELEAYCTDMLVLRQGCIVDQVSIQNSDAAQVFSLSLAAPVAELSTILQTITEVEVLKIEHSQQALLQFHGDASVQHQLLKKLLARNLPICEFTKVTCNLQDAYLKTMSELS